MKFKHGLGHYGPLSECQGRVPTSEVEKKEFYTREARSYQGGDPEVNLGWIHKWSYVPWMVGESSVGQKGKWKVDGIFKFHPPK